MWTARGRLNEDTRAISLAGGGPDPVRAAHDGATGPRCGESGGSARRVPIHPRPDDASGRTEEHGFAGRHRIANRSRTTGEVHRFENGSMEKVPARRPFPD